MVRKNFGNEIKNSISRNTDCSALFHSYIWLINPVKNRKGLLRERLAIFNRELSSSQPLLESSL